MALPPWLDRIWLGLIALSFIVIVPAFVALWAERVGWVNVGLYVLALFLFGLWRGWPSK